MPELSTHVSMLLTNPTGNFMRMKGGIQQKWRRSVQFAQKHFSVLLLAHGCVWVQAQVH